MRERKRARTSMKDQPSLYPIPQDLNTQILAQLPMKSLARFKSVAKSWNSFISSTAFSKYHLQHQSSNKHLICQTKNTLSLTKLSLNVENPKESNFVLSNLTYGYETKGYNNIVGSCNGLICVCIIHKYVSHNMLFLVWNPTTHEKRLILGPRYIKRQTQICRYGFAYDSSSDDYKLLMLCRSGNSTSSFTYLFTFRNNDWKKLDMVWFPVSPHDYSYVPYNYGDVQVIVGERLHWLIRRRIKGWNNLLIAFDLAKESFSFIPLPPMEDLDKEENILWQELFICEINECLCVGRIKPWFKRHDDKSSKNMEVWMLEKYGVWDSWNLLCRISSKHKFLKSSKSLKLYPSLFELGNNNIQGSLFYLFGYSEPNSVGIEFRSHHAHSLEQVYGLSSMQCAISCVESFVSPYFNGSRTQRSATVKRLISSFLAYEPST